MTKNTNKSKKTIIIVVVLLLLAGVVFAITKLKVPNSEEPCENCVIKDTEKEIKEYNGSAYDYIIEEMSKAEYWDEEMERDYLHMTPFPDDKKVEEQMKYIPNGSGWYLSDLATASFSRGKVGVTQGMMTYNFSEFTCTMEDDTQVKIYDFKNDALRGYMKSNPDDVFETAPLIGIETWDDEGNMTLKSFEEAEETMFYIGGIDDTMSSFIKNSMMNYAYQFELAGCPILLQSEGTLESYKNTKAMDINYEKSMWTAADYYETRKIREQQGLLNNPDKKYINFIWEQEGYTFDLRNNKDIQWVDDYTTLLDVVDNKVPDTELRPYGQSDEYPENSKIVIVFVNTAIYDEMIGSSLYLPNKTSNFFVYAARPILKEAYGFDAVYFCDAKNLKNEVKINDFMTDDEFKRLGLLVGDQSCDTALIVYKKNDISRYWMFDLDDRYFQGQYQDMIGQITRVAGALDIEWPFSDAYEMSYLLTVDKSRQVDFGLR